MPIVNMAISHPSADCLESLLLPSVYTLQAITRTAVSRDLLDRGSTLCRCKYETVLQAEPTLCLQAAPGYCICFEVQWILLLLFV